MKISHPLWRTLRSLRGNQKACVYSEPLWAIPNNLVTPFVSMYMAAIGLRDSQIGLLASLGLGLQLVWGLLSGAITDKLGRRRTMMIFGLISWTIPCIVWASARGYVWFVAALLFNSMWRVIGNCFSCMIVEDGDTDQLVNIFTILNLLGLCAGFLSPIAGLFIDRYTLVPTMRVLYAGSAVLMTVKFIVQFRMARESTIGKRRMGECRNKSVPSLAFEGLGAFVQAMRSKKLLLCVVFMSLVTCFNTIQTTFWPLFVTSSYGIRDSMISVFPLVKTVVTLAAYFFVTPRIKLRALKIPLLGALGLHALGLGTLLACLLFTGAGVWAVFFSAICEAFALAILGPLGESIMSVSIPEEDRARINSMIFAVILFISMPAGWIAGWLSQANRAYPMVMNVCILLVEAAAAAALIGTFRREEKARLS